jgi:hypothetical protein
MVKPLRLYSILPILLVLTLNSPLAVLAFHTVPAHPAIDTPATSTRKTAKKKKKRKTLARQLAMLPPRVPGSSADSAYKIIRPALPVPSPSTRGTTQIARRPSVHVLPVVTARSNFPLAPFSNSGTITIDEVHTNPPEPQPAIPYSSDIDVIGLVGVVTNVSVTIKGLTHNRPDDLDMLLVGPSGQSFHFWSDVGASNPVSNITLTVSDSGGSPLPDSGTLIDATTYKPFNADTTGDDFPVPAIGPPYGEPASAGAATFNSLFGGLTEVQANGTWSLYITDDTDGEGGTIANGWDLNITSAVPATTAGQLIISEFRLSGPNGDQDEFIELYNTTGAALTTQAADASTGLAVAASDGVTRCEVPNGTLIAPGGHYLCTGATFSYSGYPGGSGEVGQGDQAMSLAIPNNAGIAIFNNSTGGASFSAANRLDAVGSAGEANTIYKEGTGYPNLSDNNLEHSFYRNYLPGLIPKDTGDNASDFVFVDTTGTSAGAGQRLGAPGPETLSGPVLRNADIAAGLLALCEAAANPPNRVRDTTSDPANNSTFGTLSVRRQVANNSANDVTRLRFRVVNITTFPAPSGTADLRVRTSSSFVQTLPACAGGGDVVVEGLTLELGSQSGQPNGGGFNSTLSAGTVNLGTPLPPGVVINVVLLFGIQQTGTFRVLVNVEGLP